MDVTLLLNAKIIEYGSLLLQHKNRTICRLTSRNFNISLNFMCNSSSSCFYLVQKVSVISLRRPPSTLARGVHRGFIFSFPLQYFCVHNSSGSLLRQSHVEIV